MAASFIIASLSLMSTVKAANNISDDSSIESEIEEQELKSKYDALADDALVEPLIPDDALLAALIAKYNANSNTKATVADFTYAQLKSIGPKSDTGTSYLVIDQNVDQIESIEGLGLLSNIIGGIDISQLTKVTEIPDGEFENGTISRFKMPSTIKKIGKKAFSGCANLKEIYLPTGLEELHEHAFANCKELNVMGIMDGYVYKAQLPASLKIVGQQVFTNDVKLVEITIPAFAGDTEGNRLQSSTGLFYGCTGLNKIIINEGVSVIPDSAFTLAGTNNIPVEISEGEDEGEGEGSTGLSITLPNSISRIMADAFAKVRFMPNTTLDFSGMSSLANIDSEAFMDAQNLTRVILPDVSSLEFGSYAFARTSINRMYVKGTEAETEAEKEIKDPPDADPVVEGLIYLPDSVKAIGAGCFFGNTNIVKLSLSPNLSEIPDNAFDGCKSLKSITQRQDGSGNCKIALIGDAAFRQTAITNTDFLLSMNKLTKIGKQTIEDGYTIKKGVPVRAGDQSSESEIGSIPSGGIESADYKVDATGKKTFKNKPCGSEVFSVCPNLTSVHIPASVNYIASRAFYYSVATSGAVNSKIGTIVWDSDDSASTSVDRIICSGAFQGNQSLTSFTLPFRESSTIKDTMQIGRFAFAYNYNMDVIKAGSGSDNVLPNTITTIGTGAFFNCAYLDSITIQNTAAGNCPALGDMIFEECVSMTEAYLPAAITIIPKHMFYDVPLESYTIGKVGVDSGKNVTEIGNLAFFGNHFVTVDLSSYTSLEEIGAGAFAFQDMVIENDFEGKDAKIIEARIGEPTLKKVILPDALSSETGTLFLNTAVFSNQPAFDTMKTASRGNEGEIYIPTYMSVRNGLGLFAKTGVKKTVWQTDIDGSDINQWTVIPELMYYNCINIVEAKDVLPAGSYVTGIGQGAFQSSGIRSADLSAYTNLGKLGTGSAGSSWAPQDPGVFYNCDSLVTVILPESTNENFVAAKNCFAYSDNLKNIYLGTIVELQDYAFQGDTALESTFESRENFVLLPETLKVIGNYTFSGCTKLDFTRDNNLPESLESIGNNAFEKDTALSQVIFKKGLITIGNNAFLDCTGLKTVDFAEATNLKTISSAAFQNTGLTKFVLANTKVDTINNYTLKGCLSLESAEFGASVTSIKTDAICGCPKFKSLSVYPTTVIDRGIFKSDFSYQETVIEEGESKTVQRRVYTAEQNNYSVAVLITSPGEQTLPLGREFELPFYVNPKGTSALTSILIGEGSTDSSIQEMLKVSAKAADGYFWGTVKDTDGTHKITSTEYYNELDASATNRYNNMDVDVITIETLKPGKYDFSVTCGMTFDCAKTEQVDGVNTTYSIKASNVTVKFKFNVEEMKFHPVIYSNYTNNTYADENIVATDNEIVIQAASNNSKGSTRYYYNMVSIDNKEGAISTYDMVAVSDNPEVIEVSNSNATPKPDGIYETTGCTKVDASTRAITPTNNNNMYFYINPKQVGKAKVTITPKGYEGKTDYITTLSFDVRADIDNVVLEVPAEYKDGAAVGAEFNVFSSYKNVFGQIVDSTNLAYMNVLSNNTITYESNFPEYVSVDAAGNVRVLKADNSNKSVRITAKTDGAASRTATCSITVKGTGNNNSSGGNNNNSNNQNTTPANADGTYDDKNSKANVSIDDTTKEAVYNSSLADENQTSVSIPSTVSINGTTYKVTSFNAASFAGNTTVTSISVGSNITTIPNGAFAGCTALKSVSMPSSLTTIGNDAFSGCTALTSVSIPSSTVVIGDNAFAGCTALTSVSIPSSVTSIGANTFLNCKSLGNVNIPASVTSVGANAFKGCSSMNSVSIGDSVKTIGANAFYGCTKLTSVNISDKSKLTTIGNNAFYNCKTLTSITIPKKVKTIGTKAFYNCKKLQTINVKSTVLKKIGKNAFKGIHKKAIINVPKKKYKKYKKLFKGKGQKKTVKMKKVY